MLRHFQNALAPLDSKSKKDRRVARKRRPSNPLRIESLERRVVLTATPGTAALTGEVLNVCGTDAADTIVVAELTNDYFVSASFLASPQLFPKSQVSQVIVSGMAGNDTIVATSMLSRIRLEGGDGNDRIFGGFGIDTILGGSGDDLIFGNGGDDVIEGNLGADRVFAGNGNDTVRGGDGNDLIQGNAGNDLIFGDAGNDQLMGSGDNDTIFGGADADSLFGGGGNDRLFGGDGDDTLVGEGDDDELFGEADADTLLGSGGMDRLFGGAGPDTLAGGNGDDELHGGDGNDRIFGDAGGDDLFGGSGDDSLFGGIGPDMLHGNDGDDSIYGGQGADVLSGHAGEDLLLGGADRDIVIGGRHTDILYGESGDDFLLPGISTHQSSLATLNAMRSEWTASDTFENRVNRSLIGFTDSTDVTNEIVFGGDGRDAFYTNTPSQLLDRAANEPILQNEFRATDDRYEASISETIMVNAAEGVLANDVTLGATVTVSLVSGTRHGSVTLNSDGSFSYTQTSHGRDSFTYEVRSGGIPVAQATATIVVPNLPELPENATFTVTETGLEVYDFMVGTGDMPEATDSVTVAYVGYLPNGDIFDQNDMATFNLGGLIDGFSEGVEGMRVGGMRRMAIPPELGYGENGNSGAGIGGTDIIIFDVTLISIA